MARAKRDPLRPRRADPPPVIVQLLERIEHLASLPSSVECSIAETPWVAKADAATRELLELIQFREDHRRAEILRAVRPILKAWRAHEDREELRQLLGMRFERKPRRTKLARDRDFAIALAMAEHRARKTPRARSIVATKFGASEREVSRASEEFRYYAERWIRRLRQERGDKPIRLKGAPINRDTR